MTISASALDDGLYKIDELYEAGEETPRHYPVPDEGLAILSRKNGGYLDLTNEENIKAARGKTYFLVRDGYVIAFGTKV